MPSGETTDPQWPTILSLAAHEFRSPLTVVSGYIRMLLKAGPTDQQRRLLEEAEKSCDRLSRLLGELSDLANLEGGTIPFNRGALDLDKVVAAAIAALPEAGDRKVSVDVSGERCMIHGDPVRLGTALTAILACLRRELVASDRLRAHIQRSEDGHTVRITMGDPDRIERLSSLPPAALATFDEWRGGNGLRLPLARRMVEAHGGRLWAPAKDGRTAAVISLPSAS